jgi:hypothetical protein
MSSEEIHILSTDQEMISGRNAVDGHAQDFVVNDELLLPTLKSFADCSHSLHAARNA